MSSFWRRTLLEVATWGAVLGLLAVCLGLLGCHTITGAVRGLGEDFAMLSAPGDPQASVVRGAISAVAHATGWGWLEMLAGLFAGGVAVDKTHRVVAKRRAKKAGRTPLP